MAGDPSPKTRHLKVRFIPPGGSTSADADAHGPKAPAPPSSAAPPPPAVEPASSGMADEPPPKTRQLKVRFIPPRGSTSGDADAHGPETLAPPSSAAPPPPAVAPASSAPRQPDPADNRSRRPRPGSAPPSSLRPPPSGKVFSPTPPSSSTSSRRKSERGVAKILDPPPSRALMSPEASTAIPTSNSRSLRRTPARAACLDAASQHCHKDEAPTKVQDIFSGTNCKGKLPLNAGAEIQKKVQSSYLSLSRPLSSHTLPKVKQIFGDVSWKGACGKSFEGEKKISTVALITDEDMLLHESADTLHDENPARLISIMSNLRKGKLINRCDLFKPDEIGVKYMLDVHSSRHVKDVVSIATKDQDQRDNLALKHCSKGDMYYSQGSTRAALLAAGGSVKACTLAVEGMYKYAFALVRPPGHHAGLHGPSGFCLLNNVAVGAMHLLNKYQMKRIVILDWDIHHGNGTQKIFYKDNRVLVISVHRYGGRFYPVSSEGNTEHIGEGGGRGFNANICFTHSGIRDVDYITVWEHLVMPVISEFDPEIVLISAGFDAAEGDALGQCKVTPNGFATLLQMLMKFDRLVMVLEGGYNLDALSESVSACIEVLLGEKSCIPLDRTILPYSTTWEAIIETRKVLKPFWDACKPDIPEAIRSKSIPYAAQETTDQDFA